MIPTKAKILIVLFITIFSFALGRYSNRGVSTAEKDKTKVTENKRVDTDVNVTKTTTTVKEPTGKETTTIVEQRNVNTVVTDDKKSVATINKTETAPKSGTLVLSALIGTSLKEAQTPAYGLAVTKEILGPVTIGIWGLSNGMVGGSIGVSF